MTMFGMPPADPEGLRPGVDEPIGVGEEDESVVDYDVETEVPDDPEEEPSPPRDV